MLRQSSYCVLALVLAMSVIGPLSAQEPAQRCEVRKVDRIITLWSVGRMPCANPSHTYVLSHGLGGVDDRFFNMGQSIRKREPNALVLVADWTAGADKKIANAPNPFAAGNNIDITGEMLGKFLVELHGAKCFDPAKATFIGESFGNGVNHRAAMAVRKTTQVKAQRALVLNPAPGTSGVQTPIFKVPFTQSLSCVTDSCYDSRDPICNKMKLLRPIGQSQIEKHTYGMRWLQESIDAGTPIESHFVPAK
ncbi:MAG: hypothetical protein HY289_12820 [Planctomycetes bacterium]|nr:hypothetical protein [Planctomycetota bacterium]